MKKIAIVHPFIAHYREKFFEGLLETFPAVIFCYESQQKVEKANFKRAAIETRELNSFHIGPFLFYDILPFFKKDYSTLVLMLSFTQISTWILLLTKFIHKKKIILFGHGISVKRFVKEQKRQNPLLNMMIGQADSVWFYTENERDIWRKKYPRKSMVALNNTIADIDDVLQLEITDKELSRIKHGISEPRILIYCARFNEPARRADLLIDLLERVDNKVFGLIIIGDGALKPDFKKYKNVYDFGALYDRNIKNELFQLADIYIQPGWVGLSIVEAMAYGKPIFTLRRSEDLLQCVEYHYIIDQYNGVVFNTINELIEGLSKYSLEEVKQLGENARHYARTNLTMQNMVRHAKESLTELI